MYDKAQSLFLDHYRLKVLFGLKNETATISTDVERYDWSSRINVVCQSDGGVLSTLQIQPEIFLPTYVCVRFEIIQVRVSKFSDTRNYRTLGKRMTSFFYVG